MARQPGDTDFTNCNVAISYKVAGEQVLGTQQANIAFVNNDAPNNSARINSIITALEAHGLIAAV